MLPVILPSNLTSKTFSWIRCRRKSILLNILAYRYRATEYLCQTICKTQWKNFGPPLDPADLDDQQSGSEAVNTVRVCQLHVDEGFLLLFENQLASLDLILTTEPH